MFGTGLNIPSLYTTPSPFGFGQYGPQQQLGLSPFGVPNLAQQYGVGLPYGQQYGIPWQGMPGLGFGQQGLFGQQGMFDQQGLLGQLGNVPNVFGVPQLGQLGMQNLGQFDPATLGLGQNIDPFGLSRLGMPNIPGAWGMNPGLGMRSMTPSFTIHSVGSAILIPNVDPLTQLVQQFNPLGQIGQYLGQFGTTPWGRPVRVYVPTMMGLIPINVIL